MSKKNSNGKNLKSLIVGAAKRNAGFYLELLDKGVEIVRFIDVGEVMQGQNIAVLHNFPGRRNPKKLSLFEALLDEYGAEAVYCPLEDNDLRASILTWARELGYATPNLVHPTAKVAPKAKLGIGIYIGAGARVMSYADVGDFSILGRGVRLAKGAKLGQFGFLADGVNFCEKAVAEDSVTIGKCATITAGKKLGMDCTVIEDAVVTKDVPARYIAHGDPAKIQKDLPFSRTPLRQGGN